MTEKVILLEGVDPVELYGAGNSNIEKISAKFPKLKIIARGSSVKVMGEASEIGRFEQKLTDLIDYYGRYGHLSGEVIDQVYDGGMPKRDETADKDAIVFGNNGVIVRARTVNQQKLVQLYEHNDLLFAVGPAGLIVELCSQSGASGVMTSLLFWLVIILTYYFIATFISIDAVIGKIYPVFGICLIIMAVGVIFGIFTNPAYTIPEIWANFSNMHPSSTPIWSFMFITVACGAISGFHSTQSPLMARCMKSEKQGHFVFYGAMVCEGIIALIWAAAGCSLYEITGGLNTGLAAALAEGQSAAIYDVCSKTMGGVGIALAMIGVVICPITSGDTAFRSARLTLADWFKIDQDSYANRLKLCIPVLGVGAFLGIGNALGFINYTVIWRYFSWTNQTLAMIVLWAASMYLFQEKKNYWITAVPATFMSAVSSTYFVLAPECLGSILNSKTAEGATIYNTAVAYPFGVIFAIAMLAIFLHATKKNTQKKAA